MHDNSCKYFLRQGYICLITPICMNGSLQSYLRSKPVDVQVISNPEDLLEKIPTDDNPDEAKTGFVTVRELVKFSYQIALGMDYLNSKEVEQKFIYSAKTARKIINL